jgi:hypothetical protein
MLMTSMSQEASVAIGMTSLSMVSPDVVVPMRP